MPSRVEQRARASAPSREVTSSTRPSRTATTDGPDPRPPDPPHERPVSIHAASSRAPTMAGARGRGKGSLGGGAHPERLGRAPTIGSGSTWRGRAAPGTAATPHRPKASVKVSTTGTTTSVSSVEEIRPPITACAMGAFCPLPSWRLSASGSIPKIMASVVMTMGRKRVVPASTSAS